MHDTLRTHSRTFVTAAAVLFVVAFASILAARSSGTPHPPISRERAVAITRASPEVKAFVHPGGWTDIDAIPLDANHWRITYLDHGHALLDASVGPTGAIDALQPHPPGVHAAGSKIVWSRWILLGLTLLFVMASAVAPLRRIRNLDVAVVAGGIVAVLLLYDARLVAGDAYAGALLLAYTAARCGWVGFTREREARPGERPLYAAALASTGPAVRRRIATWVTIALLAVGALVTITSTGVGDVAFAGLAGATAIQHGDIPYGHITNEVVHGDTYPVFTYVMYLPFTLLSPVNDSFDNFDGALWLNAILLVAAAGLAFGIGSRLAGGRSREPGMAMAVAWLACPAVLLGASGGGNDVPTGFLVMAALSLVARPVLGAGALALATAAKVGPVGALVMWLAALRGRVLVRALALVAAVALGLAVLLVALGGADSIRQMVDGLAFQFRRGSFHSLWTQLGWGRWAQAAFQALVVTFVGSAALLLALMKEARTLRRVAALSAAAVLGLQLAANFWAFTYFAWVLPLVLVALMPAVADDPPEHQRSPPPALPAP